MASQEMGQEIALAGAGTRSIKGYLLVLSAGMMFATTGIFFRFIMANSTFGPPAIAASRATLVTLALLVFLGVFRRPLLSVRRRDLPFFALFGLIGIAGMHTFLLYAVQLSAVAVAIMLNYTAPLFAALISWRFLGERMTKGKISALAVAFVGCVFVAGAYDLAHLEASWLGLAAGIGSGFTWGMYSILGRKATTNYSPWTSLIYTMGFGALFLWLFEIPYGLVPYLEFPLASLLLVIVALVPTLFAYLAFTTGLKHLQASEACLVATIEPVVAAILAFLILGETLQPLQIFGGALVIGGILVLQRSTGVVS